MRLRIPKLREQTFEAAIVERYQCRESSVEQTWIGTYHGGGISLDVNVIIGLIAPAKRRWPRQTI